MTPSNQISVLSPLLVGTAATFCTIIVHALIFGIIVTQVRHGLQRGRVGIGFWTDVTFVTGATLLALAGHLVEIGLWALAFELCGEFSTFAAAFYHSAVNYTTLGDDTVVMSARWRLLGPFEASAGMLMFGVSTAMIFAVIQRLIQTRFGELDR
jgi:ion channel